MFNFRACALVVTFWACALVFTLCVGFDPVRWFSRFDPVRWFSRFDLCVGFHVLTLMLVFTFWPSTLVFTSHDPNILVPLTLFRCVIDIISYIHSLSVRFLAQFSWVVYVGIINMLFLFISKVKCVSLVKHLFHHRSAAKEQRMKQNRAGHPWGTRGLPVHQPYFLDVLASRATGVIASLGESW